MHKKRGNNKEKTTAAKRGNYIFKDINKLEVYVKKLFSFGCGLKRGERIHSRVIG